MNSPASRNVGLFIAFRVLFNARWYYPILAVLFLDFGLTIDQYALLNVAWAVSIVCLEVPSGALADLIGRKRMLVLAGGLMVVEMSLLAFVPLGASWVFGVFVLNRVLSGAAEACASGADESLAYDSLWEEGRGGEWPSVLARLMRLQSAAFFVVMMLGAAIYDPKLVQAVGNWVGWSGEVTRATVLRWPVYLTLANAIVVLGVTLRMKEPRLGEVGAAMSLGATWTQIVSAGRWILQSPRVLLLILSGLCIDSVIRMYLTVGSQYYRLIALPEASFGLVGSSFAVLGFLTSRFAQQRVAKHSMGANLVLVGTLTLLGLAGVSLLVRYWGVLLVLPLGVAMSMLGFMMSHYLNVLITDSSLRATVLSFKGLVFNLAYGAVGLFFASLTRSDTSDQGFASALGWLVVYFAVSLMGLLLVRGRGP